MTQHDYPGPLERRREALAARHTRSRRIFVLLLLLLVIVAGGAWLLTRGMASGGIEAGTTLVVDVSGRYVEAPSPSLVGRLLGNVQRPFVGLLSTLAMAERDERLSTVVLHIGTLQIGWGKADELRDAITRLRDRGCKTVAFLELGSISFNREYYIASAADRVYVMPGSATPLLGLAAESFFLGGLWEKLGIGMEATKEGKYKSAVESVTDTGMSEATREMVNSLLDAREGRFLRAIAEGRGMTPDAVRAVIDTGPVLPQQLVSHGLLDGVAHLDDIPDIGEKRIRASKYREQDPSSLGFDPQLNLALVYGTGNVVSGDARRSVDGGPVFASHRIRRTLLDAAKDPEIAGIIFRIDSPGGSSLASEVIWQALQEAREHGKPIIASFSDTAASGAYYVAAGTDGIVAPPGAITGSIGVFSIRPAFRELFERFGIRTERLQRGPHADFYSFADPMSEGTRQRMQAIALDVYDLFVSRVAAGRGKTVAEVDAVAQGRVWSGEQAFEVGLVDELGGLHDAVNRVLRTLDRDEDTDVLLIPYPRSPGVFEELARLMGGGPFAEVRASALAAAQESIPLPEALRTLRSIVYDLPPGVPHLIPSVLVEIH